MGPHEPYWRTNTSFSPPPPRWDFRFHSDAQSFGSSTSSNNRTNYLPNPRHSVSDGIGPVFSTPSDLSPSQQWTPPTIQEINLHEYANSPTSEGLNDGRASISSHSDSSDFETIVKSLSSHHNFTGRRCFKSKPVHPLAIPAGITDSDVDYSDVSEPDNHKCGVCDRYLSARSPWSSRQIIRSGDFPVTGVLSCRHVFHAECLDQTTPKAHKGDPPCPICVKCEAIKTSPEQRVLSKLKNGIPRLRPFREDGPSARPWGCGQGGNCVEGALTAPSHSGMLVINRNRIKKGVSLKGSSGKELAGKVKNGGGDGGGCSSSRKKS